MSELLIGGRKSRRISTVRATSLTLLVVLAAVLVAWFIYGRSVTYDVPEGNVVSAPIVVAAPTGGATPELRFGDASLSRVGELSVLRISGEAHDLGAATGRLLGGAVTRTSEPLRQAIIDACEATGLVASLTDGMRLDWRTRFLDDGMPDRDRRWVAGLVRGANASGARIDYPTLLRAQAAIDVGAASKLTDEGELRTVARSLSFVVPQPGPSPERLWVGHTLSLPGLDDGGQAIAAEKLITFARPTGRLAWAGVGWASLAGVVTGVNSAGLVVAVHPARTRDVRITRTARPIAMVAREVLETASDLDAAITVIKDSVTLGAARFVVVDGKHGRWAVVERGPGKVSVIRDPKEPAVGDLLSGNSFADDPENDRARRLTPSASRIARLQRALQAPPADLAAAAALLRDGRTPDDIVRPLGHRGVPLDPGAVHTVLIDPVAMILWVADGPATSTMRGFDLAQELGVATPGTPPSLIADIAADASADPQASTRLLRARAALRIARRRLASGALAPAMEHALDGLSWAPALPEALATAARIARKRGDDAQAKALFGSWLDGGPDLPQLAEDVRGYAGR
jgi:hypothetical protein